MKREPKLLKIALLTTHRGLVHTKRETWPQETYLKTWQVPKWQTKHQSCTKTPNQWFRNCLFKTCSLKVTMASRKYSRLTITTSPIIVAILRFSRITKVPIGMQGHLRSIRDVLSQLIWALLSIWSFKSMRWKWTIRMCFWIKIRRYKSMPIMHRTWDEKWALISQIKYLCSKQISNDSGLTVEQLWIEMRHSISSLAKI